jgi:hypothetical protein
MDLLGEHDFCWFLHGRSILLVSGDLWAVYPTEKGKKLLLDAGVWSTF